MAAHPDLAPPRAVSTLFARAIDYAGLYPPASLGMPDAVRAYGAHRTGSDEWALGRFVLGAAQLDAFVEARSKPARADAGAWPLAVLSSGDLAHDVELIRRAVAQHAALLRVEAIEAKADSTAAVARVGLLLGLAADLYVEVPLTAPLGDLLRAIRALGARAKIRTGGVTPDAFPTAHGIARFMRTCVETGVPFKATAGLHHLVRGEYPLTYEKGSPYAPMHGYLNVFVAAALAKRGVPDDDLVRVLEERSAAAFSMARAGAALSWNAFDLTAEELGHMRADALASFGSCSFDEPMAELKAARLAAVA